MRKRATLLLMLLALAVFMGACAAEPFASQSERGGDTSAVDEAEPADDIAVSQEAEDGRAFSEKKQQVAAGDQDNATAPGEPKSANSIPMPKKRMIQRDGRFVLESADPVKTQRKIEKAVKDSKGFVIESSRRSDTTAIRGIQTVSMTLRVPAESFDGSLESIRKAADRVVSESVKGTDVTEKYVDIQARLKAKKALEEQFLTIMKQAKSVQDALNVQRQLASVRSEIERIEGQKRLLESLTSMSTIRITINPPNSVSSSGTGFWYELQDAVGDGFEAALTFILFLVRVFIAVIPFLLIFVLPVALIARWLFNRVKRNRQAREIIKEAEKETDD